MSLFTSSVSLNAMALASASSAVPLLESPAIGSFLDAFAASPATGQLIVPRVTADPSRASGFHVEATPLTGRNGARTVRLIQELAAGLPEADFPFGRPALSPASGDWELAYRKLEGRCTLFFQAPGRRIDLCYRPNEPLARAVVVYGGETANVRQTVTIQGANFADIVFNSYTFEIRSVLVEGLRTYLGLPTNTPLEAVAHRLPVALDFTEQVEPSENPLHEPEEGLLELESRRAGQILTLRAGLNPADLMYSDYSEEVGLWLYPETETGKRLTPAQLQFWNWVASQVEPSEEDVAAYRERTRARYQTIAGNGVDA